MSSTHARARTHRRGGLTRPFLLLAVIAGAAVLNLALYVIFRAGGADFRSAAGIVVGAASVLVMSVVPLLIGTVAVVLLARHRPSLLRIGRWGGAVVALLTIAMTAASGFGALSFIGLSLMHVVVAAGVVVALRPGIPPQR